MAIAGSQRFGIPRYSLIERKAGGIQPWIQIPTTLRPSELERADQPAFPNELLIA